MQNAPQKTWQQLQEENEDLRARLAAAEQGRAGEARCQSEQRFCALAENMPHFVWEADPDGTPLYVNRRFLGYTGLSMEQVQAPFAGLGGVVDGRVTVTSDRGVIAYASVVDNATREMSLVCTCALAPSAVVNTSLMAPAMCSAYSTWEGLKVNPFVFSATP